MIGKIKGVLTGKKDSKAFVDVSGLTYELFISKTVFNRIDERLNKEIEFIVYHYFQMDRNRGVPVMIGFLDELEKDFFEKFITVSGIGPRAALRSFDKPVSSIAQAIEEANVNFLTSLEGIGPQRAKQIVASLQGKVGRFILLREKQEGAVVFDKREVMEETKQILRRLQYSAKEIDSMVKKALEKNPGIDNSEELLNEIYRQSK